MKRFNATTICFLLWLTSCSSGTPQTTTQPPATNPTNTPETTIHATTPKSDTAPPITPESAPTTTTVPETAPTTSTVPTLTEPVTWNPFTTPGNAVIGWTTEAPIQLVDYNTTPDPQQACERLITGITEHLNPPGTPETHQTIIQTFRTEKIGDGDGWHYTNQEPYQGHTPLLFCSATRTETWGPHLPNVTRIGITQYDLAVTNSLADNRMRYEWAHYMNTTTDPDD